MDISNEMGELACFLRRGIVINLRTCHHTYLNALSPHLLLNKAVKMVIQVMIRSVYKGCTSNSIYHCPIR